jgi:hypothetical protein
VTAPLEVQPRTLTDAAEELFATLCGAAIAEEDPDRAYTMWLEHQAVHELLQEMIRRAVGGAARDLSFRGDSQRQIAARHLLTPREVQRHQERAPLPV